MSSRFCNDHIPSTFVTSYIGFRCRFALTYLPRCITFSLSSDRSVSSVFYISDPISISKPCIYVASTPYRPFLLLLPVVSQNKKQLRFISVPRIASDLFFVRRGRPPRSPPRRSLSASWHALPYCLSQREDETRGKKGSARQ